MSKFNNSKIYILTCLSSGKIYIGCTTKSLNERLQAHKQHYNEWLLGKRERAPSYQCMHQNNYKMLLLENYMCNSRKQLESRQTHYANLYNAVNSNSNKKRRRMGTIGNSKKRAKYDEQITCECGVKLNKYSMKKHVQSVAHVKYLEKKGVDCTGMLAERVTCECGVTLRKSSMAKHVTSAGHIKYLEKNGVDCSNLRAKWDERHGEIQCECGIIISRASMAEHLRSLIHIKMLEQKGVDCEELHAIWEVRHKKKLQSLRQNN